MISSENAENIERLKEHIGYSSYKFNKSLKKALCAGFIQLIDDKVYKPGITITNWINQELEIGLNPVLLPNNQKKRGKIKKQFPTILHITDLHLSKDGCAWEDPEEIFGVGRPEHDKTKLLDTMLKDLNELKAIDGKFWPEVAIISGDFIYKW